MWISTGLCRALYTKHKYVWPYSSWPWPALIKLSCTAPLNAPTLLPLSIFLVLLSPIHLFLTFPCLHSRWWGSLSFPSLTCPRHLVNTMLWLVNGGGGCFLFPSQQIFVQLGSWMSAWGPKLVVCIVPLHCLYGQNRNTAAPEQRTMGRGVRCGEGRYFSAVVWLE